MSSTRNLTSISPEELDRDRLLTILAEHPEIRFVSVAGVDLMGHETDAKIPVEVFIKDLDQFLGGTAVQTDGSSVILPGIATINNAKIDMKADTSVKWWIDRNQDLIDDGTGLPVATIKIPCFLIHNEKAVDSRSVLKRASDRFEREILALLKEHPEALTELGLASGDIQSVGITAATELEFWVRTPEERRDIAELSTSQELKEQYWSRTRGDVRTGLEQTLLTMSDYGLSPEMGHKEVGGVKARLGQKGSLLGIMEQLEVDWRFDEAMQAADNELMVKLIIKETFRRLGIDVTFLAKPMEGVAGSGEHVHVGVVLCLKDGRRINLFDGGNDHYLSSWGYGALMGLLNNYEIMSPFIVQSNDAFRRLKKGYEAPICIVTSLGHALEVPSRNRTVLAGLIRDTENPMATRFELRSPNPHTNTYLALATMLQSMLHGIRWAVTNGKTQDELLKELSKQAGEDAGYLQKDRMYRSEEDVFSAFSDEERDRIFGRVPTGVWENLRNFELYPEKIPILTDGGVFTPELIASFRQAMISKWEVELEHRILPNFINEIRSMTRHHSNSSRDDDRRWEAADRLRRLVAASEDGRISIMEKIHQAYKEADYQTASDCQQLLHETMDELRAAFHEYRVNVLD